LREEKEKREKREKDVEGDACNNDVADKLEQAESHLGRTSFFTIT
jgi:hypothetical protein